MTRTWTRSDGVTVTYSHYGKDSMVRLWRPKDSHIIQKTYDYWEAGIALHEALMLADLLDLEEVYENHQNAA